MNALYFSGSVARSGRWSPPNNVVRDIANHFQTPGRSPGVLTCGHHVRLVVGAVNSPYEPHHIILLDPNWREPKYEPRDQEWLERQDTTFELLLPVVVERREKG